VLAAVIVLGFGWYYHGLKPELLLPLLLTTVIGMIGWYVNNSYSAARDRANKQRDLRVQYLIDAYRHIERVCAPNKPADISDDMLRGIESAIADIQLFGSAQQIELAKRVVKEIVSGSYSDPRYLLAELRKDLRRELNLDAASSDPVDIMHFRMALPGVPGIASPK
jgi:hypothetical protein